MALIKKSKAKAKKHIHGGHGTAKRSIIAGHRGNKRTVHARSAIAGTFVNHAPYGSMQHRTHAKITKKAVTHHKRRTLLSASERKSIVLTLRSKTPKHVGIHGTHWTVKTLEHFLMSSHHVHYKSRSSLHRLFKQANLVYNRKTHQYIHHH